MTLATVSIHKQQLFEQTNASSIILALMMLIAMEENVHQGDGVWLIIKSANVTQPVLQLQQHLKQLLQQQCNVEKGNCAIPMLIAMEENVDHVVGIGNVANVTQPI
jgi:hypothetical protein